jgi:hypothetical protein
VFFAWDLDSDPPVYAFHMAEITGAHHQAQLLLFPNFLPGLASNHNPPDLCLSDSLDYKCEPLAPVDFIFYLQEKLILKKIPCNIYL